MADAGWIPLCGKGSFYVESTFGADFLTVSVQPLCAVAFNNVCAHVKALVVHVRVWWIMETGEHPACTARWVA